MDFSVRNPLPMDLVRVQAKGLPDAKFDDSGLLAMAHLAFSPHAEANQTTRRGRTLIQDLQRAGLNHPDDLAAELNKAWDLAKTLRHAHRIMARDAARWLGSMATMDPQRLVWHVERLRGVSGSTVGVYLNELRGGRNPFTTGRALDLTRLMRRLPDPETFPMFRGTQLERLADDLMLRSDKRIKPDHEALERIRAFDGHADVPWLVGNPDQVVQLSEDGRTSIRILIDHKCPGSIDDLTTQPSLEYKCQLHQYAFMAALSERTVSRLALNRTYIDASLAKLWGDLVERDPSRYPEVLSHATYVVKHLPELLSRKITPVEFDPELLKDLTVAAEMAEARVMSGQVADWPKRQSHDLSPEALMRAQNIERELARGLALEQTSKDRCGKLKKELQEIYADYDTKTKSTGLRLISISRSSTLDVEKGVTRLQQAGVDTQSLFDLQPTLNKDRALEMMAAHGITLDDAEGVSFRIGLTAVKSGPSFETVQAIKAEIKNAEQALIRPQMPGVLDADPDQPIF